MRYAIAILILVFGIPRKLPGQIDDQRVRVTSRRHRLRQATGPVIWATADTIAVQIRTWQVGRDGLEFTPDTVVLPRAEIDRLDISTGRGNQAARGAAIGGGIGVLSGLIIGIRNPKHCATDETVDCLMEPVAYAQSVVASAAIFGAAGAGLGALIGLMIPGDKWEQGSVRVTPERHLGLGVTISF